MSNPTIQVEPATVKYTGEKQEPTITVKDDNGLVIDGSEYTVTYKDTTNNNTDLTSVGKYTVTITATGTNYSFTATAEFKILAADQEALTITGTRERVYYGDTIQLDTTGAKFDGSTGDPENYNITYPATTTASILKANIDTTKDVTAPTAVEDLVYTGNPLELVEAGSSTKGTMEYSTDGINFSASLPTGTNAGDYDVWYRVKGDGNHNDTTGTKLDDKVTITKQEVTNPTIEFTPNSVSYDGAVHKPTVTVKDSNGRIIPDTEYTVTYGDTDWKTAGAHPVPLTGNEGGNYDITTKS